MTMLLVLLETARLGGVEAPAADDGTTSAVVYTPKQQARLCALLNLEALWVAAPLLRRGDGNGSSSGGGG